ncbi:hypothetical protein [Tenacibaculum ovolyticum]|uniref:hypothetical protein n=1 Tax=Tenacibaculum ovolyticum TaxID=104270 RepID=UPI0007ED46F1|nr:hypothetical protein [Tenacibaculum ovolyticum]
MKKKTNKKYREIILNAAQMVAFLAVTLLKKTKIYLEWGRGTGKSFILAFFMKKMVKQMPGASFALVGSTYQQILARTLPSTKEGLAVLGLYEDVDYVVGKNGKRFGFAEPIQAPDKWDNIIHFSNGAIFQLVSLDNPNSGRGLNAYGVLGDEAALFDPDKLFYNVKTTNRAKSARFPKATLLGCEIYVSSTPLTKKGRWFTDIELKIKNKVFKNWKKYAYIKASSLVNKRNLRPEWFDEMKEESPSELIYNAEILNIRPTEILNGFYPQFNKKNLYTDYDNDYLEGITRGYTLKDLNCKQDNDIVKDKPLILSLDWGLFLSAVVSQNLKSRYKVLSSFHCYYPKTLEDIVDEFCDYYEPLEVKRVHLYYGHDGNQRMKDGKDMTYGDQAKYFLKQRGWKVSDKSKGRPAASHNAKYMLNNLMFKGSSNRFPSIEINEHNNKNLIISLERAEATEGKNGIQKLKKDERNASMKQEHTTHLSDAFDIPVWELFHDLLDGERESWSISDYMG